MSADPEHYRLTPEPIAVVDGWGLGFSLGCVIKYIARAGRKPGASAIDDLRKARWYLDHEIARLRADEQRRPSAGCAGNRCRPGQLCGCRERL